jgi:diguanylate cyclase (GGDEF)-like protein/PAS domain S-box-containing protein
LTVLLAPFVLTCLVYLSLPAFVAMLPQSRQRSRQRQLAIGAFAGMLSALGGLVAPQLIEHLSNGTHLVIRPALVAVCCFTFGPLSGAVAAALPLVAHLLTGAQDLSMGAALLQAVAVVTLGSALAVIRARHEARSNWLLLALAALLPVALAPWAAGGLATWPWHYGVAVLALGSLLELHRAYRHTVRQLSTREQELLQTLEAFGSGHWEWQLRGGRFVFIYHGVFYQAFGLPQDPGPDGVAHDVAWQRWNALRHPEDADRIGPHLHSAMQGNEDAYEAQYRMRDLQGRWRWIISRGQVVERDEHGRAMRIMGMDVDVTEQRALLDALNVSEAKYTIVYQTLPDPAGIIRLRDGCCLDVNPALARLLERPTSEIVGQTATQLGIWTSARERAALLSALELKRGVVGLPITVTPQGRTLRGQLSAQTIRLDGESCMVFVFHDLTEASRMRDELEAAHTVLQQAGRMARLGVWLNVYPVPGGPAYWSDVCYAIHGMEPGAPLPSARDYLRDFIAPEWQDLVRSHFLRVFTDPVAWRMEIELMRADGRRIWVRMSAEPELENGRLVRLRGVLQDIDEAKRAEQGLRQSEARFAQMFRAMPYPMGLTRQTTGAYIDVNPAWEQATGFSREEALDNTVVGLGLYTLEQRSQLRRQAEIQGGLLAFEAEMRTRSGERRTLLQSMSPVESNGESCWLFVLHDITERQRAEQRVREREAQLSLTISAATLSLWDWNLQTGLITGDSRWQALHGLQPGEGDAGVPWQTAIAPQHLESIEAECRRHAAQSTTPFDATWQVRSQGGGALWLRNLGTIIERDLRGGPLRMVGVGIDVTSQHEKQAVLQLLAHHDALTGLPNRVLMGDRLQDAMDSAREHGTLMGLAYLDLDGFKPVNDRPGHGAGDQLLVVIAGRLSRALRPMDCVARLGGDEFAVLMPDLASREECERLLRGLMDGVAAPYQLEGERVVVTASIGYTLFPDDEADADTLLRHADQAMYVAKQAGRNRYHAFDAAQERAQLARRAQATELAEALAQGQFALYLQPKVDMRRGTVIGAEALARWNHPQRGLLAPAAFLHLIDSTEVQALFGEWVTDTALGLIAGLYRAGLELPISINISAEHLQHQGFADWMIHRITMQPEAPPHLLDIEITESAALYDIDHVAVELERLRTLGVMVSLDDFGTGYSSLAYLRRLPLDHIKLDRSFVHNMTTDTGDRAIVRGVIGLGDSFGHRIIAEGVETIEQGEMLLDMGCTWAQGYCIARPMPAEEFAGWVRQWQAPRAWRVRPAPWQHAYGGL